MDMWKKVVAGAVVIVAGAGVGYFAVKTVQAQSLFAQFRKHGDVNGDGVVDDKDITILQSLFNMTPDSPNWNPYADLNGDGIVNMRDIAIAIANQGLTYQQWLKTKGYAKNYTVQTTIVPIKEI